MVLRIYQDSKRPGQCRSCSAAITWTELTSGKRHPFDGEIVVMRTLGDLLGGERVVEEVDTSVSASHFATCPESRDWSKKAKPARR